MDNRLRILILDDSVDDAFLIEKLLKKSGLDFVTKTVSSKAEYIKQLRNFLPNIVISDHSMPDFNSVEALKICKKEDLTIPFILVTGTVSEEFAVDCLKHGADDYILKGNLTRLPSAIASAVKQKEAENERLIAMEMLRRSEEHFRKLIENASDLFVIINEQNYTSYLSPSVERVLGYKPSELINRLVTELIHQEDFFKARKVFLRHIQSETLLSIEVRTQHKNGSWRHLECIAKSDSIGSNLILNIRDITERKIAEEVLKQKNAELEKINQELDSFVYSASHDLKAPLKSLLGLIKLAQMEFSKNRLESFAEYSTLMEKSIVKLDDTIQKILSHSANSRSDVIVEVIDFRMITDEILDKLTYMDGNSLIKKEVIVNQKAPFVSDKNRVIVVLNNLISNGIKYSNTLKANPYIKIQVDVDRQKCKILFEDNGIGIDEEFVGRVFNMFFRATERSEGSGLGLYIVKEVVSKLNGTIKVQSKIGEGTSFYIELPNKI